MSTVALGLSGHRFLSDVDKIHAGVEQTVEKILTAYPGSNFIILSSLAEGADRLLAKRLLRLPGARLWVPLPLPKDEYLQDFGTSASREEFLDLLGKAEKVILMPALPQREQSYLVAGEYILANSDVLIALWDGKPAQGKGGTGEIVNLARQRSMPLAWIHAGNRLPGTDTPTSLGAGQGRLTCENFPARGSGA